MSYDIYMQTPEGFGHTECDEPCFLCAATMDIGNMTYNIAPMWYAALGGDGIRAFHGAPGCEAAAPLSDGVARMKADPEKYRAMNPENGWGDYEGALAFLERIARACSQLPAYRLVIS